MSCVANLCDFVKYKSVGVCWSLGGESSRVSCSCGAGEGTACLDRHTQQAQSPFFHVINVSSAGSPETSVRVQRAERWGCVVATVRPETKLFGLAVTPHNPWISDLAHDRPSSVARRQRKKPGPWPPQAARALKIALLGAHAVHVPRRALEELGQSKRLLRPLLVLCSYHVQAMPRPSRGIEPHLCSPKHHENIGPQMTSCAPRSRRDERVGGTS